MRMSQLYSVYLSAPANTADAPGFQPVRFHGFVGDFGRSRAALICALTVCVLLAGAVSPLLTRNLYPSLATLHSWLELALFAFVLARGSVAPPAPVLPA